MIAQICKLCKRYLFFLLLIGSFLLRFITIGSLPIFNDESIYIMWGWMSTHLPESMFIALQDAKGPLMPWLFGIFGNVIADPLIAGRVVSVLFGITSTIGMYFLAKTLFSKQVAFIAMSLFAISPLFVFYDRQALFESGITCIGIWGCWVFVQSFQQKQVLYSSILGLILGLGFLIKASVLLFLLSAIVLYVLYGFRSKKYIFLQYALFTVVSFVTVSALVLFQSVFWEYIPTTTRYTFSLPELFSFPIASWTANIIASGEISIVYLTPFIVLFGIYGIILLLQKKERTSSYAFLGFFLGALLFEMITSKSQNTRYLVSFMSFLLLNASYSIYLLWRKHDGYKILIGIGMLVCLLFSLSIIMQPVQTFKSISRFLRFAQSEYVSGQTSGFGVLETVTYLQKRTATMPVALVLFSFNAGNPESAVHAYANHTKNIVPDYIDAQFIDGLEGLDCLTSRYPLFFVARDQQQAGLNKYLEKEKAFSKLDGNTAITIYRLKNNCKGKSGTISDMYESTINRTMNIKNGIY